MWRSFYEELHENYLNMKISMFTLPVYFLHYGKPLLITGSSG